MNLESFRMRYALVALCFAAIACGENDSRPTTDLKLKGTVTFLGTEYAVDQSRFEWSEDSNGIPGVYDISMGSGARSAIVPYLGATDVKPPLKSIGFKAVLGGLLLVGPTRLEIPAQGDRFEHGTMMDPFEVGDGVVIDRIQYVGDELGPWELTVIANGTSEVKTRSGHTANLTYEGTTKYYPICRRAGGVSSGTTLAYLCGSQREVTNAVRGGQTITDFLRAECPAELSAGMKSGDLIAYDGKTVTVGPLSMNCVTTKQGSVVCGSEKKGVQAAGCSWDVDYLLLDTVYVYGRASAGCAHEAPRCNTLFNTGPSR